MNVRALEELKKIFADRATTDGFERGFYERDVAPVPDFLVKAVARPLPDIVVRPQNTDELAALVKLAVREKIPVTARAGGSTVYFDSVCFNNGILADLNGLDALLAVDEQAETVTVGAGIAWWDLERALNRRGLAVRSYPSSAPSATVGGWIAMRGYGIGSLRYGPVIDQVIAARTVMADGSIRDLTAASRPPVAWLAASEGTLGLMAEVTLKVRRKPEQEWHGLAACADIAQVQRFLHMAAAAPDRPFNLHLSDPGCNALRRRLGLGSQKAAQAYTIAFDVDGSGTEVNKGRRLFARCLEATGAGDLGDEAAEEWKHRFFSLALKREGPALLGAELWLPLDNTEAYLQAIDRYEKRKNLGLKSYAHIVSPEYAMVMTMFGADERDTVGYMQGLALVKKLQDIGAEHGGSPYGIGLWNTPYLARCYDSRTLAELRRRKEELDPEHLMNPGKLYKTPFLLNPPLFALGMDMLAATTLLYRGKIGRIPE